MTLTETIVGTIEVDELYELLLLINTLVIYFPTSFVLQDDKYCDNLTLSGGYKTLNLGSRSKHKYIFGVVSS
jgi:hypothetical protein